MAGLLFGFNALTLHEIFVNKNTSIYEEGEFVEGISAFCYMCASILTFFRGFDRTGVERKLTWFFSLTCLLFFIRELDLEDLNIPSLLQTIGFGTGRDVFFVVLYLGIICAVAISARDRIDLRSKTLLQSMVVRFSIVGGLLLVLGSVFERMHLSVIEEVLEMNGSFVILFAAILHERIPMCPPVNELPPHRR